jgi:Flp pilus assembly protein TadB
MYFSMPSMRRSSRHPLVRALSLLLGMAVIGVLMVFGLVVAGVLLVGGTLLLAWRQWTRGRQVRQAVPGATHQPQVLEGEFVVVQQGRPVAH